MATFANLTLGSRKWRDYFANTNGWANVSLAPSRTRRVFDPVARPTVPTVVLLAPGEYAGPLHIASPYPVLIRPSQLGDASKVVIRCPEPDRTSRRIRFVNPSSSSSSATEESDELPLDPALILSNGAQVFVEGIQFLGRVEVTDGASVEFLDCSIRLSPHVAVAHAQIAGATSSVDAQVDKERKEQEERARKRAARSYYTNPANDSTGINNSSRVVTIAGPDALVKERAAMSVLGGNMWASNCVFDVLAPNGIGLLASSFSNPCAVATGEEDANNNNGDAANSNNHHQQQQQQSGSGSNIHIQTCVLRRASYGFVFYGGSGFAPRVENNRVTGCSVAGIVCSGASRGTFRSNHVGQCDKFGVVLEGHASPWLHQNIVEENGICGVAARDSSCPTLVRNTLLANGTCQLFCADVATVRAQANHFSGESVNGQLPSSAGVSSYAARNILSAPKGDIYGCCFTDNSNGVLEACVIECADACVISSTGATVKCINCSLQPEGGQDSARRAATEANEEERQRQQHASSSAAAPDDAFDTMPTQAADSPSRRRDASGVAFSIQRAFVKSDFATLTTDGSRVQGAAGDKTEVRALEDFPDVDAVVHEIPKHLFASTASFDHSADEFFMQQQAAVTSSHGGSRPPSRPGIISTSRPGSGMGAAGGTSGSGGVRNDAAIRMSLSWTPRRPMSGSGASPSSPSAGTNASARRQHAQSVQSYHAHQEREFRPVGHLTAANWHAATDRQHYHVQNAHHQYSPGGGGGSGTEGGGAGSRSASAQRLVRFAPQQRSTDWHELKDKKTIYSLKNEVSRLRKQLHHASSSHHHHQDHSTQGAVTPRPPTAPNQQHQHQQLNNSSSSSARHTLPHQHHRLIAGGDMEEGSTHVLGFHRWNNAKMRDFYHGKASLSEVRQEERRIPGTDASLGERLHDRWLRHRHDEDAARVEEDDRRVDDVRRHALSKEQQRELGKRLHDEVMDRFKKDRMRLEKEEDDRHKIYAPFMHKNAERRKSIMPGADGDSDSKHQQGITASEEEEMRCQRISDRLKEQAEQRDRMHQRLMVKYHMARPDDAPPEKKLSRKQVEAYCASLHKSHRDEELASAAMDTINVEFAIKAKERDEAKRNEYLGRSNSPRRSKEQIEAYSDSLYRGHKDIGAHKRAVDLLSE